MQRLSASRSSITQHCAKLPKMACRNAAEALLSGRWSQPSTSQSAALAALLPHLSFRQLHSASASKSNSRFYKSVHVAPAPGGGYQLLLDTKPVRTPGKHPVVLPTYPLALAVAAEWEWQASGKPQLHTMPMMSLVAHAMDQPRPRDKVIEHILKYVHTDAACCLYEEGPLARKQKQVYLPILEALRSDLGWRLVMSDSITGSHQSEEQVEAVWSWLAGLDRWHLSAAEQLTSICKSVVLAAALVRGNITPAEAIAASRLEEDHQAAEWGRVEAGHDLDEADIASRVYGPSVFIRLLRMR